MSDRLDPEDLEGAWERLEPEDQTAVMLWRAVLAQSIRDMASVDIDIALDAAVWLGTEDYKDVCDLALVEHASLEAAIRESMADENPLYRKAATSTLADRLMVWPQDKASLEDAA